MNDAIEFRPAARSDLDELVRLYRQIGSGSEAADVSAETVADTFEKVVRLPGYQVFLATAGGKVVGSFLLVIVQTLGARCAPEAIVEDVVVDESARGTGIGKRMMEFVMREAARAGCYKLVLSSHLDRTGAHAFYERLGFRRHGYSFTIDIEQRQDD